MRGVFEMYGSAVEDAALDEFAEHIPGGSELCSVRGCPTSSYVSKIHVSWSPSFLRSLIELIAFRVFSPTQGLLVFKIQTQIGMLASYLSSGIARGAHPRNPNPPLTTPAVLNIAIIRHLVSHFSLVSGSYFCGVLIMSFQLTYISLTRL